MRDHSHNLIDLGLEGPALGLLADLRERRHPLDKAVYFFLVRNALEPLHDFALADEQNRRDRLDAQGLTHLGNLVHVHF